MKNVLLACLVLSTSLAFASKSEDYVMFCGSRAELNRLASQQGEVVTEDDIKEMTDSRSPILKVLNEGSKGIEKLLREGSQNDVGSFAVVMTCGVIVKEKRAIAKYGCFNLRTNKAVMDKGGIVACEQFLKSTRR